MDFVVFGREGQKKGYPDPERRATSAGGELVMLSQLTKLSSKKNVACGDWEETKKNIK